MFIEFRCDGYGRCLTHVSNITHVGSYDDGSGFSGTNITIKNEYEFDDIEVIGKISDEEFIDMLVSGDLEDYTVY